MVPNIDRSLNPVTNFKSIKPITASSKALRAIH